MPISIDQERFSRQIILPTVGLEGQKKWIDASVFLVGEGVSLQACANALCSVGVGKLQVMALSGFDSDSLVTQYKNLQVEMLPEGLKSLPETSLAVIMSDNKEVRRRLSRTLRHEARPVLYAWSAGSGFALFAARHQGSQCPCLECFEIMNPKAFSPGQPSLQRMIGALAASEALQWILKGHSDLQEKVWITSLDSGVSFQHEVQSTYKCPAQHLEEGEAITP